MAPELLQLPVQYDKTVDWWAVGVLAYELAHGATPFFDRSRKRQNENILRGQYRFPKGIKTSQDFQDLISKLLVKDPAHRLGAKGGARQILAHPWFGSDDYKRAVENMEVEAPIVPAENEANSKFHDFQPLQRESNVPKNVVID